MATRILVQLPPTYTEEIPVKWYGAPPAAEIEVACRQAVGARVDTLEDTDPLVLVAGEGWHPGVIGIVASRLVERIGRPA